MSSSVCRASLWVSLSLDLMSWMSALAGVFIAESCARTSRWNANSRKIPAKPTILMNLHINGNGCAVIYKFAVQWEVMFKSGFVLKTNRIHACNNTLCGDQGIVGSKTQILKPENRGLLWQIAVHVLIRKTKKCVSYSQFCTRLTTTITRSNSRSLV